MFVFVFQADLFQTVCEFCEKCCKHHRFVLHVPEKYCKYATPFCVTRSREMCNTILCYTFPGNASNMQHRFLSNVPGKCFKYATPFCVTRSREMLQICNTVLCQTFPGNVSNIQHRFVIHVPRNCTINETFCISLFRIRSREASFHSQVRV